MIEYRIKNNSDKFDIEKCCESADMSDPEAQYLLAGCYAEGNGVGQDMAEAELRKKVDKIDATAIEDPEGLWSTMIEEMGAGIC